MDSYRKPCFGSMPVCYGYGNTGRQDNSFILRISTTHDWYTYIFKPLQVQGGWADTLDEWVLGPWRLGLDYSSYIQRLCPQSQDGEAYDGGLC